MNERVQQREAAKLEEKKRKLLKEQVEKRKMEE